jgi:NADH:ubiquinone oxidoreductase subunit 5 (subunit L)/multisubunit Na+/H+ antiporter MnhA subunit
MRLKWIPGTRKPKIILRRPKLQLPTEIPTALLLQIAVIFIFAVYMGLIFDIVKEPLPLGSRFGVPVLIDERLDSQFIIEGIVAGMLMFVGFIGFVIIFYSTRYFYEPSYARTLLLMGVIAVIAAYFVLLYMMIPKLPQG